MRSLLKERPDLARERLERTRDLMNQAVPDCIVTGYEELIDTLSLPDPDDRHVLAAALHGGAEAIVTYNLADFPDSELADKRCSRPAPRRIHRSLPRRRCDRGMRRCQEAAREPAEATKNRR
jgi:hypothetical protein